MTCKYCLSFYAVAAQYYSSVFGSNKYENEVEEIGRECLGNLIMTATRTGKMPFTPAVELAGKTDTPHAGAIYAPPWIRNSRLSNVTVKHRENNDAGHNVIGSAVDTETRKRPSWCSINDNAEDLVGPEPQQSFTSYRPSGEPSPQASAKRPNSFSSSSSTSSDDSLYDNAFANRLRNSLVERKKRLSSADPPNANFESFFPGRTTTDSVMDSP